MEPGRCFPAPSYYIIQVAAEQSVYQMRGEMDRQENEWNKLYLNCMLEEWELEKWRESIIARWDEQRLKELIRGRNRYMALALALKEIDCNVTPVFGVNEFVTWAISTEQPSLDDLKEKSKQNLIFKKVYEWGVRADALIGESITGGNRND